MVRRAWCPALVAAVLLATGCGADDEPKDEQAADTQPAKTSLEGSVPHGPYAATYVLGATNIAEAEQGARSTGTFTFTPGTCTEDSCTGTVAAPGKGTFTWDGTKLSIRFDDIVARNQCVDEAGRKVKASSFTSTTLHSADLTSTAAGEAPTKLSGRYSQRTRYDDFRGGCKEDGSGPQHATFTLTLDRKQ